MGYYHCMGSVFIRTWEKVIYLLGKKLEFHRNGNNEESCCCRGAESSHIFTREIAEIAT